MLNRAARYLLAAIQLVIGWEWFVSGTNKVLSGTFPQSLLDTLKTGIQNNPNSWYVSFLQKVAVPQSIPLGYMIEWTEVIVGLALLAIDVPYLRKPMARFIRWSLEKWHTLGRRVSRGDTRESHEGDVNATARRP